MISLHHTHLMASDVDATIAFWCDHFGATVVDDFSFAGARNVFLRVGSGRLHFYDQPPKGTGPNVVHHLGIETNELQDLVDPLTHADVSVTAVRKLPSASYAMAKGPDGVLIELFQPVPEKTSAKLRGFFETA